MSQTVIDFNNPGPLTADEDEAVLMPLDARLAAPADTRSISLDQARELIPEWISKFESLKKPYPRLLAH